jgi:hypothetical protein
MISLEAYKKFLLKVNKNDTNGNINISKGQFILIFNEQKRNWLKLRIEKDQGSDLINYIEEVLILGKKLRKYKDYPTRAVFELPKDYFSYVSSYSIASKGECKNVKLFNWDTKPKNINIVLQDEDNNPSFDWRETNVDLSSYGLEIYKTDFSVDEVYLDYYREPIDIDIEGYQRLDGKMSTNIESDLDNSNIEEILDMCAIEAQRNYENVEQFQIAQTRNQSHV